jgi:hypothetical protein
VPFGTGLFAGHEVEGREIIYSGFAVSGLPATTSQPATPTLATTQDDASRFAAALAARAGTPSLGGPFAGTLHQRPGMLAATGVGATTADFSATVTVVNPRRQTETPWDAGFAFHSAPVASQAIYVDSEGYW